MPADNHLRYSDNYLREGCREPTHSPSATMTDDAKIIVSETELIVTTVWLKGKTGRKEAREKGESELKRKLSDFDKLSACVSAVVC